MALPPNIRTGHILITDLSQALKRQRDFLKWMSRRYLEANPDQSAAFGTGARLIDEIRTDLLAGLFDVDEPAEPVLEAAAKELFTPVDDGAAPALEQLTAGEDAIAYRKTVEAGRLMVDDDHIARGEDAEPWNKEKS